jgi:hypothetical protein
VETVSRQLVSAQFCRARVLVAQGRARLISWSIRYQPSTRERSH